MWLCGIPVACRISRRFISILAAWNISPMCPAVQFTMSASLAFDPDGRRLFFTTNNTHGLRNLNVFDLKTRKRSAIGHNLRVGDLVFNRKDGSLWGVRHDNGLSSHRAHGRRLQIA